MVVFKRVLTKHLMLLRMVVQLSVVNVHIVNFQICNPICWKSKYVLIAISFTLVVLTPLVTR